MRPSDVIEVDWMLNLGNRPSFRIRTECPESDKRLPWERRGPKLHRRDQEHTVDYFSTDGSPTNGYGGAIFEGELTTGQSFRYQGAWSSRADCVNEYWPEDPIIEVHWGARATAVKVADIIDWFWDYSREANRARCDFGLALIARRGGFPRLEPTQGGYIKAGTNDLIVVRSTQTNKIEFLQTFKGMVK